MRRLASLIYLVYFKKKYEVIVLKNMKEKINKIKKK
jgi:hypothetical protein